MFPQTTHVCRCSAFTSGELVVLRCCKWVLLDDVAECPPKWSNTCRLPGWVGVSYCNQAICSCLVHSGPVSYIFHIHHQRDNVL